MIRATVRRRRGGRIDLARAIMCPLYAISPRFDMEGRMIKQGSYKGMLDAFGIV